MTPQEFKAWFDGYSEGIEEKPSPKQWTRIKERIAEIDGKPVTKTVYVDRYWSPYHYPYWVGGSAGYGGASPMSSVYATNTVTLNADAAGTLGSPSVMSMAANTTERKTVWPPGSIPRDAQINSVWDSGVAMRALGKADAQADAA